MQNLRWTTSDFYSACLARASGKSLSSLTKEKGNFITFVFDADPKECEEITKKHWDGTLRLSTRLLIETINELKTRVHERMNK
jgi:hypothetical protein